MEGSKNKDKRMAMPVERHDTAAWANIEKTKNVSRVAIPGEAQAGNAKDHVDTNEK